MPGVLDIIRTAVAVSPLVIALTGIHHIVELRGEVHIVRITTFRIIRGYRDIRYRMYDHHKLVVYIRTTIARIGLYIQYVTGGRIVAGCEAVGHIRSAVVVYTSARQGYPCDSRGV